MASLKMSPIHRNPDEIKNKEFDLIIIGGGIYGAMFTLEATLRNLRPLLVERDDFGQHTSFNSLRIIHGGFRYLQSLDLGRLFESAKERRWFLQNFPDFVKPFPCMMPLYGKGLRHPSISRLAVLIYDFLIHNRNLNVTSEYQIPDGKIIKASDASKFFPLVDVDGLQGGLVWHDAIIEDSQRLLTEVLKLACGNGANVLNYFEAVDLLKNENKVVGVKAVDHINGSSYFFKSSKVINCAGPWCRKLATQFDRDEPTLFQSMLAWNVLFDREALSAHGLAVSSKKTNGHTYFFVPWKNKLLVGTGHAHRKGNIKNPWPQEEELNKFINDLNCCIPGLNLCRDEILYVFPGLQSATIPGGTKLSSKEVIIDHTKHGGPKGFYSVSGVKFTTSRIVAEKTLNLIFPEKKSRVDHNNTIIRQTRDVDKTWDFPLDWQPDETSSKYKNIAIQSIIDNESAQHLDDLVFRRSTLWENPSRTAEISLYLCTFFNWEKTQCEKEVSKLSKLLFPLKG